MCERVFFGFRAFPLDKLAMRLTQAYATQWSGLITCQSLLPTYWGYACPTLMLNERVLYLLLATMALDIASVDE